MKDYHFYLEYPTAKDRKLGTHKMLGNHSGTVIAVYQDQKSCWISDGQWMYSCVSALQDIPNSAICSGACSDGYLREKCKRISEKMAREIHPVLFHYLDQPDNE